MRIIEKAAFCIVMGLAMLSASVVPVLLMRGAAWLSLYIHGCL